MSINQNFPEVSPSLTLDFANSKTLDPRITFERSSIGTYVGADGLIKTAAADEARFDHDPVTGESLGLLIEESRTNYIRNSSNLYNACFETSGSGTDGDGTFVTYQDGSNKGYQGSIAPTGEVSVRIKTTTNYVLNNGYSKQRTFFNINFPANTRCFASIFYKNDTTNPITSMRLQGQNTSGPTQGNVYTIDLTSSPGVSYGDGWYRLTVDMGTSPSTNGFNFFSLYFLSTSSVSKYCEFAGFQVEVGSFPTSYIPTSGSTVTRAQDFAKITGTNFTDFYNQSEGTILCNFKGGRRFTPPSTTDLWSRIVGYGPGNRALLSSGNASANNIHIYNGLQTHNIQLGPDHINGFTTAANAFGSNSATLADAGYVAQSIDGGWPTPTVDKFVLGNDDSSVYPLNGYIRKLSYYPKRITNAQLQNLTK